MKQLCMMNDTVMHPKATPRTLDVVASTSNACSRSGRNQREVLRGGRGAYIHQRRPRYQLPVPNYQ